MEYNQEGEKVRKFPINIKRVLGIAAAILIALGAVMIAQNALHVDIIRYMWPIILVIIGVGLVLKRETKDDS